MQAKHTSFNSFKTALLKAAVHLDDLAIEAGPWLTEAGAEGIEELCRALDKERITVALPLAVSPALAKVLAAQQSERQRSQTPRHVQALQRDVAEEKWELTGDTLKVDTAGVVRDGGHRTAAVIGADKTIVTYVVFGVTPESVADVDSGKPRSPGQVLYMSGGAENANAVAALATRMWCWDKGFYVTPGRPKMSREEMLRYVGDNPWLNDFVKIYKGHVPPGFPASVFMTAAALFARVDEAGGEQFMASLMSGANLPEGSPILYLRNRVPRGWNGSPGSKRALKGAPAFKHDQVLALMISGWRQWLLGKPVPKSGLYMPAHLTNKNFPQPQH